jgi:hypothetical protein
MNVAEAAGKYTNFVHLNVPPSATYLLAAPSTRPEAVTAIAERSAKGERLSYHAVKDEIEKAKAFAPPKTPLDLGYKDDDIGRANALRAKIEKTAQTLTQVMNRFGGIDVDDARLKSEWKKEHVIIFGQEAVDRAIAIIAGVCDEVADEAEIYRRVNERVKEILGRRDADDAMAIAQAKVLIDYYKGQHRNPLAGREYLAVLDALRPDASTPELREKAFRIVKDKELVLRDKGRPHPP